MKVAPYAERRQELRPLYFKAAEEVDCSSCWRALEYGWASTDAGGRTEAAFSSGRKVITSRLAEGVGFEPTVTSLPRSISSRVPSTGLSHPSLANTWDHSACSFERRYDVHVAVASKEKSDPLIRLAPPF